MIEIWEATIGYQTIDKRTGKWIDELKVMTKRYPDRWAAEQYVKQFFSGKRRIMWTMIKKQLPLEGFIDEVHKEREPES